VDTIVTIPAGYDVRYRLVAEVDNQGEPCEVCQLEDNTVTRLVYGVVLGEHASLFQALECCAGCTGAVVSTMDRDQTITVEVADGCEELFGGLNELTDADTDRMHGIDCRCPHPDGE